jgi:hypothetical protein
VYRAGVVLILASCFDGTNLVEAPCVRTDEALSDAPVGASDAAAFLATFVPVAVRWDLSADGSTSSALSLRVDTSEELATTVRYDGDVSLTCRPGTFLRLPIDASVDIDEGGAVSSMSGAVEISALTGDGVTFVSTAGSAELDPQWLAAAESAYEVDGPISSVSMTISGPLDAASFLISFTSATSSGELWRGVAVCESADGESGSSTDCN